MGKKNVLPKGAPEKPGVYFVCIASESGAGYEWKETFLDTANPDPIWKKAICWSYT